MALAERRESWQKPYSATRLISNVSIAIAKCCLAVASSTVEERVDRQILIGIFQRTRAEIQSRHANCVG